MYDATQEVAQALLVRLLSMQEADERTQSLLSSILVSVDEAVMIADRTRVLVGWNRKAEEQYGWTAAEALGQPQWGLLRVCEPELPETSEETHWHKDGHPVFVEGTVLKLEGAGGEVVGFLSVYRDVAERLRLEQEALHAGELERNRIGQDLHDGISQMLSGISFLTRELEARLDKEHHGETSTVARVNEHLRDVIEQVKDLSHRLYPVEVETLGLQWALRRLARCCEKTYGIPCTFQDETIEFPVLDASTATHLFRIAQEALDNAVRHGSATAVRIRMQRAGREGTLFIEGEGGTEELRGASVSGMGLQSMRKRARAIRGVLHTRRSRSRGSMVQCRFPLPRSPEPLPPGGTPPQVQKTARTL